ncbi:alpha/beta hydrolase family protein [Chiayiivirga flava]|uniref:Peptidase S9 prolyl oligopeptidase catalytic domain-containing protein n=1 Tax=Chiayiivirga flava TaxID=659595 RepID=A0A7W8D4F2_9GAMM|nr:hypothetical protein [Chiayiivirga flava]MBB5207746.1 hypothetical protein [Chiayiivirga flava]
MCTYFHCPRHALGVLLRLAVIVAALSVSGSAVAAITRGVDANGTPWIIAVPDDWQAGDGLVLVQHGFVLDPVAEPDLGLSAARMLEDGFAIAASGYRQHGWALFDAIDDNLLLLDTFRTLYGVPGPVVTHGASMGGLIALKLAEDVRVRDMIVGVVALCPAVDGMSLWDRAFDLRMAYDTLCAGVAGGTFPEGSAPLPWVSNPDTLQIARPFGFDLAQRMREEGAIRACLALDRPPRGRTPESQARVQALRAVAGSPNDEALTLHLALAYYGLSDLLRSPDKLDGANPFYNRAQVRGLGLLDVMYGRNWSADLPYGFDSRVRRVSRDESARTSLHRATSLDGTATAKIVSVHTSGDSLVPARELHALRSRLEYADHVIGVVSEARPSHCGFSPGEIEAAWRTMREWLRAEGGATPQLSTLQAHCERDAASLCRFDPIATAEALDGAGDTAILRRAFSDAFPSHVESLGGLWWDPSRPAQGLIIEELDDHVGDWHAGEQRVSVSWYTWAPRSDPQPGPRWLHGIGRVYERSIVIDSMHAVHGGRFGVPLAAQDLQITHWGEVTLHLGSEAATLHYRGPSAYGEGTLALQHLLPAGTGVVDRTGPVTLPRYDFSRRGTYIDPRQAAGGWLLNPFGTENATGTLVVWFTWTPNGQPTWLFGLADGDSDEVALTRPVSGGYFDGGYTAADLEMRAWGTLRLEGCDAEGVETIHWYPDDSSYAGGSVGPRRVTVPRYSGGVLDCE